MAIQAASKVSKPTGTVAPGEGFKRVTMDGNVRPRLVVLVEGDEKTGKTHFALTAPGPIYYQSFNLGTEGLINRPGSEWADKEIWLAEYDLRELDELMLSGKPDLDRQAAIADGVWTRYLHNQFEAIDKAATSIIDCEDEVWELFRVARSGTPKPEKQGYLEISPEYRRTLNAFIQSDCNLIMIEKLKEEWNGSKPTGNKKRRGFKDAGFVAQVIVRTWKRRVNGSNEYGITVTDCRLKPDLEGMELPNDFNTLMEMVWA